METIVISPRSSIENAGAEIAPFDLTMTASSALNPSVTLPLCFLLRPSIFTPSHVKTPSEIEPFNKFDHYNPLEKKVRISEDKLHKKSITSIAVVAHEIGHAIQDKENYKPLLLRQKLIEKTIIFQRVGSFLLIIGLPSIFAITKSPFITFLAAILIMGCLSTNVVIHLITLPVEFDASFKRALPILQKYVPNENMRQCRSVLRAAAFTYLAQSIVSIFRLKVILFSFINILKSIIRR